MKNSSSKEPRKASSSNGNPKAKAKGSKKGYAAKDPKNQY
jgi:hypothetical protein